MADLGNPVRASSTSSDNTREHCEKRLAGLREARRPYEADWQEIASLASPTRSRFLGTDTNQNKRRANAKMYDGYGIQAFRLLTGGMTSGLSSPSRPWFKLATYDDDLMENQEVKDWLGMVERQLYAFFARTNFYSAVKTGYAELGLFGTEATVMEDHWQYGAVCHALTVGEYWLGLSDAMVPDTLYRQVPMSVLQVFQKFGKGSVSSSVQSLYDQSNYDKIVNVFHAIEPNKDRDPKRLDKRGKAFRSIWWDEQESDKGKLLRDEGFSEQPFWAPRWDTTGGDTYGTSPGFDALADLRGLQLQAKRLYEVTDMVVFPPVGAPTNISVRLQPKAVTYGAAVDLAGVKPIYETPYQAIAEVRETLVSVKRDIAERSFADLFMAITNMPGVQPRNVEEIAARNEEKLTQLGPVIERVSTEKLQVAIDRAFGIMARGQMLPPAPEHLAGMPLKVEFVSILAQAQRMVGLGQIERTAAFVGNLAGAVPQVLDKLNTDEMVDEYADRAGAPSKMIRSDDEVAKIREGRQRQQNMQQAAAMMPAVKDGADAAQLLSQTDVGGGQSLLNKLGVGA